VFQTALQTMQNDARHRGAQMTTAHSATKPVVELRLELKNVLLSHLTVVSVNIVHLFQPLAKATVKALSEGQGKARKLVQR
jgi:hypothetical protein